MPNLHSRFFRQLLIAFVLVIILSVGAVLLTDRIVLSGWGGPFAPDLSPTTTGVWVNRLADHYRQQGSWEGLVSLIADFPCGPAWAAGSQDWPLDYVLAETDGTIVASSGGERPGQSLSYRQELGAIPVMVGDREVGLLILSSPDQLEDGPPMIVRIGLLVALIAGCIVLVVGLARRMSQPLVNLTVATKAVAGGDLGVRVPVRSRGEIRDLAIAFNAMIGELARADELHRNLTADVAHELRTPLSVIRGKLEGLLDGVYPSTPEHLAPVLEQIKLLTQLVEDLHLLSLAEADHLRLEKQPTSVGDLLRDAQVNFGPLADDRKVKLALDLPTDLPQVMADRRSIAQVLGNLLTNALRHTPSGGCVALSAAVVGEMVRVTVTDTGTGIARVDQPYIFERFWRGEKSRSRAAGGRGLGLAIAKHLVRAHDGEIGVESPVKAKGAGEPGKGAMFLFTLPLAPTIRRA
jgi:signal transduction histidine kinase